MEVSRSSGGKLVCRTAEKEATVEVLSLDSGRLSALLDGEPLTASFALADAGVLLSYSGDTYELRRPPPPGVDETAAAGGTDSPGASLTAPMPGTVVRVMVGEGDDVEKGQPLLVLEAMKMEQTVVAPHAGRVSTLPYAEGSLVPGGAVLAEIEEPGRTSGRPS